MWSSHLVCIQWFTGWRDEMGCGGRSDYRPARPFLKLCMWLSACLHLCYNRRVSASPFSGFFHSEHSKMEIWLQLSLISETEYVQAEKSRWGHWCGRGGAQWVIYAAFDVKKKKEKISQFPPTETLKRQSKIPEEFLVGNSGVVSQTPECRIRTADQWHHQGQQRFTKYFFLDIFAC